MVSLETKNLNDEINNNRPGLDLICIIDKSASM